MWILAPPLLPPTSRSTGDWRGHLGKADCWISWSHWDTGLSATGHLQSQHLTFHAPHQLLHLFPVHLTVTTCQSLHSPWGTFHVLTIMFNFWIHSTSCSVTTVSDFHIPGRYLSHPTECQLGICQGNSEEHQVFLAHHDMVESWLMDLLKFMNLKSIAYFYIGKCTADPSRSPPLKKSPLSKKGDLRLSWWKFHRCCF